MAENSASASPSKVPASGGDAEIAPANSNPNMPSPHIPPSPSMGVGDLSQINSPQLSQSHALSPAAALDYASKQQIIQSQQQQPSSPSQQPQSQAQIQSQQQQQKQQAQQPNMNFQMQQSLQRSGSMPRLSQIQQQFGASAAAGAMRQHAGMYGGQMNLGGAQIQQQQLAAAAAAGGMGRSGIITQAAQLPMLPGQTTQHFNMQSQMLTQPRQKSLLQTGQFNPGNSSAQALQGMQNMGMISNLSMNPQLRAYGQRIAHGQMRQQQLQQQIALTSPQKLPGQSLPRTPSAAALNSQVSGLMQNGQSTMVQTTLSQQQQQWLKHLQPSLPSPVSPSYHLQQQRQQQSFLPQQLASSQHHQKPMALTQQQISQLMQQQPQPQLGGQQQHLLHQQQLQQIQQLQQQQQLQSPRLAGHAVQNPLSLSGSQEEAPASGVTGGNSSQGTEATNQLLGKRKIHDLVMQVDPHGKLDPEVEDLLLQIADDFIDSVTTFACSLAKHRKSSTLDTKDVLLHLEKNWNLSVPGYSREERKYPRTSLSLDIHKRRRVIRESAETHLSEGDVGGSKVTNKQLVNNSGSDHPINPSSVAEQLSLPVVGSQIAHKPQRF
ncbi:transcription initiation factor TFIID subunit 12b-like [Zingiber officinale]|uniref:transcription initiation factor TFIID subunit 12b-like n=1 Tax=Zingiber officinale TaxID=94328 RepID=UPI001C4C24E6|nr:transcription initiation factor TFIID subunit 12b-like [Zingiber officinale]